MTTSTTKEQETTQSTAPTQEPEPPKKVRVAARKTNVATSQGKSGNKASPGKKAAKVPKKATRAKAEVARPGSKTEKVLDLLKRSGGATLKKIQKATGGWLPHSVRGFLSGTVHKKMGLTVTSTKAEDGERSYSIKA
jgi:hypothetical protein